MNTSRVMNASRLLLLIVLSMLILSGCTRGRDDLEVWVAQTLERPPEPLEPIPTVATPTVVIYDATGLPDPFMRNMRDEGDGIEDIAAAGTTTGPRPDPNRRREFLEQFPLDSMAMVGTIEIDQNAFALVADIEGTIHRVQAGNYLGQNHGRILDINQNRIAIVELVRDGASGWMEREAQIMLSDDRPQQR